MNHDDIGPHRPGDPRGLLVFEWLPDDLQHAEDGTQAADYHRSQANWGRPFRRPATSTEHHLLRHLGFAPPGDLYTIVSNRSGGLRTRVWPQIQVPAAPRTTGDGTLTADVRAS
jgi:hypothetical protein